MTILRNAHLITKHVFGSRDNGDTRKHPQTPFRGESGGPCLRLACRARAKVCKQHPWKRLASDNANEIFRMRSNIVKFVAREAHQNVFTRLTEG